MNDKINTIVTFLKCLIIFFIKGKADSFDKIPEKILIASPYTKAGDVVTVTPMLRAIKEKYPKSNILFIGRGKAKDILKDNEFIDEYLEFTSDKDLFSFLKNKKIDYAFITRPGIDMISVLYLSGIRGIVSISYPDNGPFSSRALRMFNLFIDIEKLIPHENVLYKYLSMLSRVGIKSTNIIPALGFSDIALDNIKKTINNKFFDNKLFLIGVAPGAASQYRIWPTDRLSKICNSINKKYKANFIFFGAGDDKVEIENVISGLEKDVPYINFVNQSFDEMKATMSLISLLITNDSAPAQFARAFNIPTVVFAGPTDEREHHEETKTDHIIVGKNRGEPVTYVLNYDSFDEMEAKRQIECISLEQAQEEIDQFIKKIKK